MEAELSVEQSSITIISSGGTVCAKMLQRLSSTYFSRL
jgi:hypothetical protein